MGVIIPIDLDKKINYIDFYTKYFQNFKPVGSDELQVLCPFHNDTKASMTINKKTGMYHCFACGAQGNAIKFLEEKEGLDSKEAYKKLLNIAGIDTEKPKDNKYTIQHYSKEKKFSLEFLKSLGITTGRNESCINIPYYDEIGKTIATRQRYPKHSERRFTWTKGSKTNLYGLWKLEGIKAQGYCVIVEGESDTQTMWGYNYPALGIPGASTFKKEWVPKLEGIEKLYVHIEQDTGGETVLKKITQALADGKYHGEAYYFSLPKDKYKDPSDLHLYTLPESQETTFKEVMDSFIAEAKEIDFRAILERRTAEEEAVFGGLPFTPRLSNMWRMTETGIEYWDAKLEEYINFCNSPFVVSKRLKVDGTKAYKYELTFKDENNMAKGWQTLLVTKSNVSQARSICAYSDFGLNITSENARKLVQYISDFTSSNSDIIPNGCSISQLGWHNKEFLPVRIKDTTVIDIDENCQKWLDAYREEGNYQEWKDVMSKNRTNNIFRFILSTSFASPLLRILKNRMFILHNWANTRSGKTAALYAATSVWGNPEELKVTFNATKVGLERLLGLFNDLPLAVDEKQMVTGQNKDDFIDNFIYMSASGSSKVRGAKTGGVQAMKSWQSIVMTTGEEPLSGTTRGGANTRTLEIEGSPFNHDESKAREVYGCLNEHYGHAGKCFIDEILKLKAHDLQERFKALEKELTNKYPDKVADHIRAVACVALADEIVTKHIFKDELENTSLQMGLDILGKVSDAKEADEIDIAYEEIRSWCSSNDAFFIKSENQKTHGVCYGKRENKKNGEKYDFIYYILTPHLKQLFKQVNMNYNKCIKGLKDRGCLYETDTGRNTFKKRITAGPTNTIAFDCSAKEKDDFIGDESKDYDEEMPF